MFCMLTEKSSSEHSDTINISENSQVFMKLWLNEVCNIEYLSQCLLMY